MASRHWPASQGPCVSTSVFAMATRVIAHSVVGPPGGSDDNTIPGQFSSYIGSVSDTENGKNKNSAQVQKNAVLVSGVASSST